MQIVPTGRGISFDEVKRGATFRFAHKGKSLIGLKVFLKETDAAVVLTDGSVELPPMTVFRANDMDSDTVLELVDVAFVPSSDEKAVVLPPGYLAEPGELELQDGKVLLVFPT